MMVGKLNVLNSFLINNIFNLGLLGHNLIMSQGTCISFAITFNLTSGLYWQVLCYLLYLLLHMCLISIA